MSKRNLALAAGVLLTAGVIGALAAQPPGPTFGGGRGMGMMGPDGGQGRGGMRGWFGPRTMTADEYDARTRERFARLDKNSDGILDGAEIETAMAERGQRRGGGRGPGGRGAAQDGRADGGPGERMLARLGAKDGKLTKDAFLAEAKRRFAQLDLNNDGKITDDDLPPMMRGKGILKANGPAIPGPMGNRFARLRQADAKQDGIITQEAFLATETKRFDDLDRNKDGVVDKADFELMRKEMLAYRVKRFLHAFGADADGKVTKDQFYKLAKERFARLDTKGEGRVTFGGGRGDGQPGWARGPREGGGGRRPDDMGPPNMGPSPKN